MKLDDIKLRLCENIDLEPEKVEVVWKDCESMKEQIGQTNDVLGLTCFHKNDDERFNVCGFAYQLQKTDISLEATVWHELCHAEAWIKDGRSEGHDERFQRRLWRKPFYAIWSMLIIKFVWKFIK